MGIARYFLLFISILNPAAITSQTVEWTPEMRKVETEQIDLWRSRLSKAESKPEDQRLDILSEGLRNMGLRSEWEDCNPDVIRVFNDIKSRMLSTIGFAHYFENRILSGQKNQTTPLEGSFYRGYEEARFAILGEVLAYLPSPETIVVYGNFLSDETDIVKEPAYPVKQANCDLAINGLRKIGLRGFPNTGRSMRWDDNHMQDLEMWRSWWGKVKSGKLAFSFEGQNVEYRFKTDGTWIEGPLGTTSPKDRATHSRDGQLRSAKRGAATANGIDDASQNHQIPPNHLSWIAILIFGLIGFGCYAFKIRFHKGK